MNATFTFKSATAEAATIEITNIIAATWPGLIDMNEVSTAAVRAADIGATRQFNGGTVSSTRRFIGTEGWEYTFSFEIDDAAVVDGLRFAGKFAGIAKSIMDAVKATAGVMGLAKNHLVSTSDALKRRFLGAPAYKFVEDEESEDDDNTWYGVVRAKSADYHIDVIAVLKYSKGDYQLVSHYMVEGNASRGLTLDIVKPEIIRADKNREVYHYHVAEYAMEYAYKLWTAASAEVASDQTEDESDSDEDCLGLQKPGQQWVPFKWGLYFTYGGKSAEFRHLCFVELCHNSDNTNLCCRVLDSFPLTNSGKIPPLNNDKMAEAIDNVRTSQGGEFDYNYYQLAKADWYLARHVYNVADIMRNNGRGLFKHEIVGLYISQYENFLG